MELQQCQNSEFGLKCENKLTAKNREILEPVTQEREYREFVLRFKFKGNKEEICVQTSKVGIIVIARFYVLED